MIREHPVAPSGPLNYVNVARLAGWESLLDRYSSPTLEPGCCIDSDGFAHVHPERPQEPFSLEDMAREAAKSFQLFAPDRARNLVLWQDEPGGACERWVLNPPGDWFPPRRGYCPDRHHMTLHGDELSGCSAERFDRAAEEYAWEYNNRETQGSPAFIVGGSELKRCLQRCGWIWVDGLWMASPEAVSRYLEHSFLPDLDPEDLPPFE